MINEQDEQTLDFSGVNYFDKKVSVGEFDTLPPSPSFKPFQDAAKEYLPFDPQDSETVEEDEPSNPNYGVDESWFAENIELFVTNPDALEENLYSIIHQTEMGFNEFVARVYLHEKGAGDTNGIVMWEWLKTNLGFESAKEGKERNAQIGKWAQRAGAEYYHFDKLVRRGMAISLDKEVSHMSETAQSEIGMGITSENEEVVRDAIEKRTNSVKELDPLMENSTQTLRDVKSHEKNGNHSPALVREKDLSDEQVKSDYVLKGRMKVGTDLDPESGEMVDRYEYYIFARLALEMPKSEELRPQHEQFQKNMLRRVGGKESSFVHGEVEETSDEQEEGSEDGQSDE